MAEHKLMALQAMSVNDFEFHLNYLELLAGCAAASKVQPSIVACIRESVSERDLELVRYSESDCTIVGVCSESR
jgi:hypothetical protein